MAAPPSIIAGIRRTARSGDTLRAWQLFESAGLLASTDPNVLSLRGRLLKDRGLKASGHDRVRLLVDAGDAYLASAGERRATYPLINAATIAFLNEQPDTANRLARRTIELLDSRDHEPETPYWLAATRAEAAFLLGDFEGGRAALEQAIAVAPHAWEDQAATLRQLEAILAQAGRPTDLLEPLRPPPGLHFGGLIGLAADDRKTIERVQTLMDEIRPGFVYGALAAGADIVVAELAVARGAALHVILPASVDAFRARSVVPYGGDWAVRFDRLLELAVEIEAPVEQNRVSRADVALSEDIAMGLAIRRSRALASRAFALRVRRATDAVAPSDRAWQTRGLPLNEIVVERSEAFDSAAETGVPRAVLAFNQPLTGELSLPPGTVSESADGCTVLIVPDLAAAADFAAARLGERPDIQAGLDYRVVEGGAGSEIAEIAMHLALAAPAGAILAACPGALALDLRAPHLPFEAAGEVITAIGNLAVSIHQ